jgi:hypothetical protein
MCPLEASSLARKDICHTCVEFYDVFLHFIISVKVNWGVDPTSILTLTFMWEHLLG